eukprot:1195660-Pyramimonas_sp.AAC.1
MLGLVLLLGGLLLRVLLLLELLGGARARLRRPACELRLGHASAEVLERGLAASLGFLALALASVLAKELTRELVRPPVLAFSCPFQLGPVLEGARELDVLDPLLW